MSTLLADAARKSLLPIMPTGPRHGGKSSLPLMPVRPGCDRPTPWRQTKPAGERLSPILRVEGSEGEKEVLLKIAHERRELFGAFGLVYESYMRAGLTRPNPCCMRLTPYHMLSTTEVFVAMSGGRVICTMSLVGDGDLGLPIEQVYAHEVYWRRLRGGRLGEVSCLADRPEDAGFSCRIPIELMRLLGQCAKRRGMDELLIAVHPRHVKFYERCAAFRVIGEERSYSSVCNKPAVALALDLHNSAVTHPKLYQKFFGVSFPDDALRYRPVSEQLLAEMGDIAKVAGVTIPRYYEEMALIPA
ncbi:MAG: hypothetical protein JW809_00570 [Pirellulales bacterium]|nr:hypothetical protein [Pirellulales bacterium]